MIAEKALQNAIKFNTIGLVVSKLIGAIAGLLFVTISIQHLDPERLGVWFAVTSLFAWFSLFDIGLGNGLRNKLSGLIQENKIEEAREYVSTAYALVSIIFLIVFVVYVLLNQIIDWSSIINSHYILNSEIARFSIYLCAVVCLKFIVQLIVPISAAMQMVAIGNLIESVSRLVAVLILYAYSEKVQVDLLSYGMLFFSPYLFLLFIFSITIFVTKFRNISPSISRVRTRILPELFSFSSIFFIIQVCGIVVYQSNVILVSNQLGPQVAGEFSITFQYVSYVIMIFTMFLTPYWSAITAYYTKNDLGWIKNGVLKLERIWFVMFAILISMVLLNDVAEYIWLKNKITFNLSLLAYVALYTALFMYGSIYVTVLNGVSKLQVQFYVSVISAIVHIPLSLVFIKLYGIVGPIIPLVIYTSISVGLYKYQSKLILEGKEFGLWNA